MLRKTLIRVLFVTLSVATVASWADIARADGTYTFTFPVDGANNPEKTPAGTVIRITAKAAQDNSFDQDVPFAAGKTQAEVASEVATRLINAGWLAQLQGNKVTVTHRYLGNNIRLKILKIDSGVNAAAKGFGPQLDGKLTRHQGGAVPGAKYKVSIDRGIDGLCSAGTIDLVLTGGLGAFATAIPAGSSPDLAAEALFETLATAGFPDVEMTASNEVAFLMSPSYIPAEGVETLSFNGSNLHIGLELPPPLMPMPTVSGWGLGAIALLLLSGIALKFGRRRAGA